jgi:hypothetical protein
LIIGFSNIVAKKINEDSLVIENLIKSTIEDICNAYVTSVLRIRSVEIIKAYE